jgi:hypothetical protein
VPTHSIPVSAIPSTLRRGHFFVASVASAAFLAEVLTVSLSNVPFSNATTYTGFTASTWLSCSTLAFMLLTVIVMIFHRQLALPIQPNTVAAVLCYLCNSHIPERLDDIILLDGQEIREYVT